VEKQMLAQLDAGTRERLVEKLAARRKGAWKKLFDQITSAGQTP